MKKRAAGAEAGAGTERPRQRAVTIVDVAREAEVSVGTVSDVLNRGQAHRYSESTRERIRGVVKRMGYAPNRGAQKLASRSTRDIGVILTHPLAHPFFGLLATSIDEILRRHRYHVEIAAETDWAFTEDAPLRRMEAYGMSGLIIAMVYAERDADALAALRLPDIPILVFGTHRVGDCDVVDGDLVEVGRMVGRLLKGYGHPRVGYFGFVKKDGSGLEHNPKAAGLMEAMGGEGAAPPEWQIPETDANAAERVLSRAHDTVARWHHDRPGHRPTAFMCANDRLAMALVGAFRARGYDVPRDVSVVGCDNLFSSEFFYPALTTVDHRVEDQVGRATAQLLGRLNGSATPWTDIRRVPPVLIERGSVAPPPRRMP